MPDYNAYDEGVEKLLDLPAGALAPVAGIDKLDESVEPVENGKQAELDPETQREQATIAVDEAESTDEDIQLHSGWDVCMKTVQELKDQYNVQVFLLLMPSDHWVVVRGRDEFGHDLSFIAQHAPSLSNSCNCLLLTYSLVPRTVLLMTTYYSTFLPPSCSPLS